MRTFLGGKIIELLKSVFFNIKLNFDAANRSLEIGYFNNQIYLFLDDEGKMHLSTKLILAAPEAVLPDHKNDFDN